MKGGVKTDTIGDFFYFLKVRCYSGERMYIYAKFGYFSFLQMSRLYTSLVNLSAKFKHFSFSAKTCKTKWKCLKDSFRNEVKRCNAEPGYIPKWNHFNSLQFLQEHIGGIGVTTDQQHETKEPKLEFCYDSFTDPEDMVSMSMVTSNKPLKRKFEEINGDVLDTSDFLQSRHDSYFEDEDLCFFKSLVNHVKLLTPQRKMKLRMKIQQLVYDEVYGQVEVQT